MPKSRDHIPVDGALEGHDDAFELVHSGPPPILEFGLVARRRGDVDLLVLALEARSIPLLPLPAPPSAPGDADEVRREIIAVPPPRLRNQPPRPDRGLLQELPARPT